MLRTVFVDQQNVSWLLHSTGSCTGNLAVGGNSSLVGSRDAVSRDVDACVAGRQGRLKVLQIPDVVSLPPCAAVSLSPLLVPFLLRGLEQEMWLVSAALCQFGPAVQIAGV